MKSIAYIPGSDGSANASLMTVTQVRTAPASTITVNTVAGVPAKFFGSMGTPHTFTDPVTGETITVISEATAVDFAGRIDAGKIEIDYISPGYTDLGSQVGDIIMVRPTTDWANIVAEFLTPTGTINPFAGSSAPAHWLLCDGSAVSRTDYARLFDIVGTTFGEGDASSTFNLPDLRNRSAIGAGQGTYVDTQPAASYNVSDTITVAANDSLHTGKAVVLTTTGTAPGGLTAGNTYYVIRLSSTTIKLATSRSNAVNGSAINITSTGTGNHTLTLTFTSRALGAKGGEEAHSILETEMASHFHNIAVNYWSQAAGYGNINVGSTTGSNRANIEGTGTNSKGGNEEHNILNPYLALNYIIKT